MPFVRAQYILVSDWRVKGWSQDHITEHERVPAPGRHVQWRHISLYPFLCALTCLTVTWPFGVIFRVSFHWVPDNNVVKYISHLSGSHHWHVAVGDSGLNEMMVLLALEDSKWISAATFSLSNCSTYYTFFHLPIYPIAFFTFPSFLPPLLLIFFLEFLLKRFNLLDLESKHCHRNAGRKKHSA